MQRWSLIGVLCGVHSKKRYSKSKFICIVRSIFSYKIILGISVRLTDKTLLDQPHAQYHYEHPFSHTHFPRLLSVSDTLSKKINTRDCQSIQTNHLTVLQNARDSSVVSLIKHSRILRGGITTCRCIVCWWWCIVASCILSRHDDWSIYQIVTLSDHQSLKIHFTSKINRYWNLS